MNWKEYKFRCHRLGDLMTDPKGKALLSQTTKTYLYKVYDEEVYGIKEVFSSKEMRKGLQCEDDSISLINDIHGMFLSKNEVQRENEWVKGTPDIITPKVIIDVKTSWSLDTFRRAELSSAYYWQMISYLWLWNKRKGYICYCLVDTPYEFIQDSIRQLSWSMGMIDDTHPDFANASEQLIQSMTFSHIDPEKRLKVFAVELHADIIEKVKERVALCREFLEEIPNEDYGKIDFNGDAEGVFMEKDHGLPYITQKAKEAAAEAFGVETYEIDMTKGTRDVTNAKHTFRNLMMPYYKSVTQMAKDMGVKSHATIHHSLRTHKDLQHDKDYKQKSNQARDLFERKISF